MTDAPAFVIVHPSCSKNNGKLSLTKCKSHFDWMSDQEIA